MNTRILLNFGLILAFVALAAVLYFRPGLDRDTGPDTLSVIDPAQVTEIGIVYRDRDPVTLVRDDGVWYVQGPTDIPAADVEVRTVLRLAASDTVRSYPAGDMDLARLELHPPLASVTLGGQTIEIGGTEPLDGLRYARSGDTVHLIVDQYQHLVQADRAYLVSPGLLAGRKAIRELRLPSLRVEHTAEGQWVLEPHDESASTEAITSLVEAWQTATALYVRGYRDLPFRDNVVLYTQDSDDPVVLEVVSQSPDLVLARPDWDVEYHLPATMIDRLLTPSLGETAPVAGDASHGD
jgi:hypothetical protein